MLEDVIDGYVSIERAAKDYGVVVVPIDPELDQFEIDASATEDLRASIATQRHGWLNEDARTVAERYRTGELTMLDLIRRYGVIVD